MAGEGGRMIVDVAEARVLVGRKKVKHWRNICCLPAHRGGDVAKRE